MKSVTVALCVFMAVTLSLRGQEARTAPAEPKLPLWPYPHEVSVAGGECDLKGKTIFIPSDSGEKSAAIADAVAKLLAAHMKLGSVPKVERKGSSGKARYALAVGAGPDSWAKAAGRLNLDKVHPTLHDQAYLLEITPDGATIVSPGSWGLFYGAVTLSQLARCSAGSKLPCAAIRDWPDLEVRGVHVTGAPNDHRKLAGVYALDTKVNMLVWENHMAAFSWETHPEFGRSPRKFYTSGREYGPMAQQVRSLGVEVAPLRNMSIGHRVQSGAYPYVFLGDNATYFWAMTDVIDAELEVFTPRYYHLGLDEEKGVTTILYPSRNIAQWRDVAVELMKHLRRRGVMGMMWSEILFPQWGGKSKDYDWEGCVGRKFPDGYFEFASKFPRDLVLVAWFYWTKKPEDTLDGPGDLRRQAKTGMPVMAGSYQASVEHQSEAAKILKPDQPNVLGVLTTSWGGRDMFQDKFPRHPEYVRRAAGPFWNTGVPGAWPPEGKASNLTPFWDDGTDRHKTFRWPAADPGLPDLACLLDADPPDSLDKALVALRDKDWRVWTSAREQLIAAGLPAAPALLAAMSKEDGEIGDRIEGCLSRVSRDGRKGRKRGALDAAKVLAFLRDKNESVRDMAAELVASCVEGGAGKLRPPVKDATAGASCIRALGLVRDTTAAGDMAAVAADGTAPARSRAEAARALGILKAKDCSDALRKALRECKDKEVRKAALWSLALLGCKEADKEIAVLLESDDEDTRFRAAIALTILQSAETKKLEPWLLKDRHSLELAAWAMWKTWDGKDAAQALEQAAKSQADKNSRKRLEMLAELVVGKGDKEWGY